MLKKVTIGYSHDPPDIPIPLSLCKFLKFKLSDLSGPETTMAHPQYNVQGMSLL